MYESKLLELNRTIDFPTIIAKDFNSPLSMDKTINTRQNQQEDRKISNHQSAESG